MQKSYFQMSFRHKHLFDLLRKSWTKASSSQVTCLEAHFGAKWEFPVLCEDMSVFVLESKLRREVSE